ncbi:uncharacterized protein LOC125753653 isoform X4 [Canis lupus dingo]|uniref:uncharacterized protein LOC125753653 isoform X4 n=1 Tax=Canis lupus dingo TaxID=286419 RepID=UPI0020C49B6F|nr:uncharacterized protein LOC125753653 isoform X4 [Canis lupus dingo]
MACHSPGRSGISSPLTPVGEEGIPNGTLSTSDANRPLVQRKPAFCWSEERFRRGSKNRAGCSMLPSGPCASDLAAGMKILCETKNMGFLVPCAASATPEGPTSQHKRPTLNA